VRWGGYRCHPPLDSYLFNGIVVSPKAPHVKLGNMECCINHEEGPWGSSMS
jgi:hypothetical protein